MSQIQQIDVIGSHPEIPTDFVANMGNAVPIANTLELLGETVSAGTNPFRSIASGNTVTYQAQISQAIAATDVTKIGLSNFNSDQFDVDANGFVSLSSPSDEWIDQGTSLTVASNTNYFATAAVTFTLPASPSQGDIIEVYVDTASSVVLQANTGQTIRIGSSTSTVSGTLTNTQRGDYIKLIYRTTGALWASTGSGSWNPA